MRRLNRPIVTLLSVTLLLAGGAEAFADSWLLPGKQRYCSANAKYCVDVDPKPVESQLRYFEDQVKNADNPGAGPGMPRTAAATVFVQNGDGYDRLRSFPLLNAVAPVKALVSSDGRYLVTFDNWHSVGFGDNVVVLYRLDGTVIRKYSLAQLLSRKKVEDLPRSVSSIWWGGEHRLDEERGELVLQVLASGSPFKQDAKYSELRIRLATGRKMRR
jgi:hypothetical protein